MNYKGYKNVRRIVAMAALFVYLAANWASAEAAKRRRGRTTTTPPAATPTPAPTPSPATTGVWRPAPQTTWNWQLSGTIKTSVNAEMYDIDLFDAPQQVIDTLHAQGKVVICYMEVGGWEDWRPDAGRFPASVIGRSNGWAGEKWIDIRQINLLAPIMRARLDLAVSKRCDGIEPDLDDGYSNKTGFPLTYQDQITYNRWIAAEAHARNLSIGLKNDVEQVADLVNDFDWTLNEECHQYNECNLLAPFIQAGKAVFNAEYQGNPANFCSKANAAGFSTLKLPLALNGSSRVDCLAQY